MRLRVSDAMILARVLRAANAELVREPDGVCHVSVSGREQVLPRAYGASGDLRAWQGEGLSALPHSGFNGSAAVSFKPPASGATPSRRPAADPQLSLGLLEVVR